MKKKSILLFINVVLAISFIYSDSVTYKNASVKFETPKNWKLSNESGNDVLTNADKKIKTLVLVIEEQDLELALQKALELMAIDYSDVNFAEPLKAKLNGMPYYFSSGPATSPEGRRVEIDYSLFMSKKAILVFSVILPGGEKSKKELDNFVRSFKKL